MRDRVEYRLGSFWGARKEELRCGMVGVATLESCLSLVRVFQLIKTLSSRGSVLLRPEPRDWQRWEAETSSSASGHHLSLL